MKTLIQECCFLLLAAVLLFCLPCCARTRQVKSIEDGLKHPAKVRKLILRSRNLEKLPIADILKFPNLQELSLGMNKISDLPPPQPIRCPPHIHLKMLPKWWK